MKAMVVMTLMSLSISSAFGQNYQEGGVYGCAQLPPFIDGLDLQQPVAIDTTITRLPGVVLRETAGKKRMYRHESWKMTGHVGSTVRDSQGNIFVIPIPSIDLETNPLEKRNRVYRIGAKTGVMTLFAELPMPSESSQDNPFGTLGLALDCQTNSLYVSSVAASTQAKVNGVIYRLDAVSARILDKYQGFDAMGMAVFNHRTGKRLYFGDTRSSSIYSVLLNAKGNFIKPTIAKYEASLLHVKNGDSTQVRKIRFGKDRAGQHVMTVSDSEFAYRMQADTSRRYRSYVFNWSQEQQRWMFVLVN